MMSNVIRLTSWEDKQVKYALEYIDQNITATMIYSTHFNDEMEIRIIHNDDRFSVRGHKSIMDQYSFDDFKNKVQKAIDTHLLLNVS